MVKKTLIYAALFAVLVGCGSSRDTDNGPDNSAGSAVISGVALVGETLTASATDADGVQSGTATYQWTRSGELIPGAASSTYTLTPEDDGEEISVIIRYTDELGFRETSVSGPTFEIAGAFTLGATFIHGLVDGATCNIYAVDAAGAASSVAAATGTTASGVVDFGALVPIDGTGLIECTGGTYTDEATGLMLDAPDTRAIVLVDGDISFTVSPLTEIAAQRSAAAGDLNTALTTHNALVAAVFGVSGDITRIRPTDIQTEAVSDDEAGAYATALALISQLDANDVGSSTAEIIENLTTDLVDSILSEETINDVGTARTDLASSPFASNLNDTVLQAVEAALANTPEPATFEGLSGTIPNDVETALEGTVTIIDVNPGEAFAAVQTDTATTYGTFSIAADGAWTYTVDTTNATVAGLDVGTSVNDTIAIESVDGTSANLVIRIAALTKVVRITDPGGDTGEIRFNLDEHLLTGKLSFSFLKEVALGSDGNVKDAYVALYGSEDSNRETLIDLRIQGDQFEADDVTPIAPRFFARNTDHAGYPGDIVTHPFTEDQWYDVEITWDVDAVGQEVTVIIDGEVVNGGPFQTAAIVGDDCGGAAGYRANCLTEGVENIQFRFGDNDRTIPFGSYFVDDILVYDNEAGTGTPVFQDDFENSTLGTANTLYREEATVEVITFDRATAVESTPAQLLDLTASIEADDTDLLTGTVLVFDPDLGENMVVGQTNAATTFGAFSIMPAGMWEYSLDTADATIAALLKGEFETDTITITSIDGTTADLVITILGVIETSTSTGLGSPGNKFANVTDVAGTTADATDDAGGTQSVAVIAGSDTGELRIDLGSSSKIVTGRMTFQMYKGIESNTGVDGFVLIGGVDTGGNESLLDLRLDQSTSSFDIRNGNQDLGTFTTDTIYEVEITWDASGADDANAPLISLNIDGVPLYSGVSGSTNLTEAKDGVRYIQFRVADGDDISRGDFRIDELVVYETVASVESEVFSDNFEAYTAGESLDANADDAGTFTLAQTPSALIPSEYNDNSFSVTVGVEPGGGLGTAGNQFANVTDVAGTTADATDDAGGTQSVAVIAANDTGELRIDLGSSSKVVTGRMTFQMYKGIESNTGVDGFVLIGGVDTGGNESLLDLRLDQSTSSFDIRNGNQDLGTFTTDTIYEVEITWDASSADDLTAPTVSLSIDGVPLYSGASGTTNMMEAKDGVRYIQFRVADGDDISRGDFRIDKLVVYETVASVESEVFSDDFEAYTAGESLDANADDAGTFTLAQTPSALIPPEYNDNSFSVTVGVESGGGLGNAGNKFANVTDVAGTTTDAMDDAGGTQAVAVVAASDTGELRIDLGSSSKVVTGRMTFQMYKGIESNTSIDGFVLIGGVDTGSNEALLDLRLDQSTSSFDIRNGTQDLGTFDTDTVYEVEITWDASAADDATAPAISLSIDGVPLYSGVSGSTNLTEAKDGVRYIQFRVADGDDISRGDFRIDELVVYETVASVESEVFSDDFEAYTTGESLDANADNAGSLTLAQTPSALIPPEYNDNSFSVTVGEE